jgi:hypothetical protein
MYARDESGKPIVGTLMRVEEDPNSRYRFEIWFDYTRQIMNTVSEGAMVAVPNFYLDPKDRRQEWSSVLEISTLLPVHYAIGQTQSGFPGFLEEAVRSAAQDWIDQESQSTDDILIKEIYTIKVEVREAYGGEMNLDVERRSSVFDQVVDLDHRIRIYNELIVVDPIYRGLEKRLQRIEDVLPSRNYTLRDVLCNLHPSFHPDLRKRLEVAFGHFEREEYESVITECGKAEGIMFSLFKRFLVGLGVEGLLPQIGPAISKIREILKSKQDADALSLSKSGRLELLVLSMFETLHYFRDVGAHDRAEEVAEEKLPEWQVHRRSSFTQKPEYARLVLVLALQIALELGALLDHQGRST